MENVFGPFYKTSKIAFDQLHEELTDEGYTIEFKVVHAADYGVLRFVSVFSSLDHGSTRS